MAKNTDTSIKLLVLYDILCKMTDEDHALSTNEIINELAKRGIAVSRKVLPSDIALLNKYGYEVCSYTKRRGTIMRSISSLIRQRSQCLRMW